MGTNRSIWFCVWCTLEHRSSSDKGRCNNSSYYDSARSTPWCGPCSSCLSWCHQKQSLDHLHRLVLQQVWHLQDYGSLEFFLLTPPLSQQKQKSVSLWYFSWLGLIVYITTLSGHIHWRSMLDKVFAFPQPVGPISMQFGSRKWWRSRFGSCTTSKMIISIFYLWRNTFRSESCDLILVKYLLILPAVLSKVNYWA